MSANLGDLLAMAARAQIDVLDVLLDVTDDDDDAGFDSIGFRSAWGEPPNRPGLPV